MTRQTLLRPEPQTPTKQASARAAKQTRPHATSHRRHRTRSNTGAISSGGDWRRAVLGLLVACVLSLLAGALLAVHGPSSASSSASADGPALTLRPEAPATPGPTQVEPQPAQKPAEPAEEASQSAGMVTLQPGDTLYQLARTYDTTVETLQRFNDLGSSTLIYAGETLRVSDAPQSPHSPGQAKTAPPASAPAPDADSAEPTTPTRQAEPMAKTTPSAVIDYAEAQLGKPYIWGGTGPGGYDCSGLVMRAWQAAGVDLPRTTWDQAKAGRATTRAQLVPGDLVITAGGGHVQLYIGDGKAIHAPRPGRTVTVTRLAAPSEVVSYRHIAA